MTIDEILEMMEETLDKSPSVPFINNKRIVNGDRIRELINDIRLNMPREIQDAKKVEYESQRIISDAKLNADGIVRKAEERAAQLTAKEPVVIEAKKRADDILKEARQTAVDVLKKAQSSAAQLEKDAAMTSAKMLNDAETMYNKNLLEVKAAKERLQRSLKSSPALNQNTAAAALQSAVEKSE